MKADHSLAKAAPNLAADAAQSLQKQISEAHESVERVYHVLDSIRGSLDERDHDEPFLYLIGHAVRAGIADIEKAEAILNGLEVTIGGDA